MCVQINVGILLAFFVNIEFLTAKALALSGNEPLVMLE